MSMPATLRRSGKSPAAHGAAPDKPARAGRPDA